MQVIKGASCGCGKGSLENPHWLKILNPSSLAQGSASKGTRKGRVLCSRKIEDQEAGQSWGEAEFEVGTDCPVFEAEPDRPEFEAGPDHPLFLHAIRQVVRGFSGILDCMLHFFFFWEFHALGSKTFLFSVPIWWHSGWEQFFKSEGKLTFPSSP